MDLENALTTLRRLADGIDPATSEIRSQLQKLNIHKHFSTLNYAISYGAVLGGVAYCFGK